MTERPFQFDDISPLLAGLCDGTLDDDGFARLERLLATDPAARQWYLAYMDLHGELCWGHRKSDECGMKNDERQTNTSRESGASVPSGANVAPLMLNDQCSMFNEQSFPASVPHSSFIIHPLPSCSSSFLGSALFSYLVATVILGTALAIAWAWKLPTPAQIAARSVPNPSSLSALPSPLSPLHSSSPFVGRITGMVDCQWSDPHTAVPGPVAVPLGRKYALSSGLMEITYDTGAKVILQGPCRYEVESAAGGYLSLGKLTARVEKKVRSAEYGVRSGGKRGTRDESSTQHSAFSIQHSPTSPQSLIPNPSLSTIHYPLFTVRTPTAVVTDLGTEFGVEVDKFGATTSHVFRGSVRLQAASASGDIEGAGQVLRESESARVEPRSVERITMLDPSAKPNTFVRELPKQTIKLFDLVDVVAGGDGFSGKRNRGIDPTSGRPSDTPPPSNDFCLVDDGKYHRVGGMPFVDGVFVPDSRRAPVQLDSAGHTFVGVARSSDPVTSGYIWAGGDVPLPPIVTYLQKLPIVLDGVDYTAPNHGVLCLHANKGITFDLEAIRLANPTCRIVRFCAAAANLDALAEKPGLADIRIFVDGRVCFQRRAVNRSNSAFAVVVPISDKDRFLTLMCTDGEDKIYWDWIVFGDPHLVLSPIALHAEEGLPQP